jgi:hypothetical protein
MYDFESSAVFISRLPMFFIKSSELNNSKINLLSIDDNNRIFNLDVSFAVDMGIRAMDTNKVIEWENKYNI